MSGFILALGDWDSGAFLPKQYYTVEGHPGDAPVLAPERERAYVFPLIENAENVRRGDPRLATAVVLRSET